MNRPTTLNPFGSIKGLFWTPKLQKIKWGQYCGTPCSTSSSTSEIKDDRTQFDNAIISECEQSGPEDPDCAMSAK